MSKQFTITLNENELSFIINAVHGVDIKSADARVVADLQLHLITELQTGGVEVTPTEPASE